MSVISCMMLFGMLVLLSLTVTESANVNLRTTLGTLSGSIATHEGSNVSVYYGIPFSQPPIGDLRFKPPVPAQAWEGIRDATSLPNSCWQTIDGSFNRTPNVEMWNANTNRSEDCLYLNVWIPQTAGPKAVMVWIYGGGFWGGTSTLDVYNALVLAARNNIIVVSFNYRVGALGFMYCGTPNCPGNVGLLDQVMALKWIKDNAENMEGDPARITIFGESAGAVSVGFHLMSPLSMDLFTNAIMMSSSPTVYWGLQNHEVALNRTRTFANLLGSTDMNMDTVVSHLRTISPQLLVQTHWRLTIYYFDPPFTPVVDGAFLPKHPLEIMAEGKVKNTSIIMGVVKNEGTYWLLYGFSRIFGNRDPNPVSSSEYATVVDGLLRPLGSNFTLDSVKESTMNEYYAFLPPWNRKSYLDSCDAICGDTLFKCPVVNFAQYYSTKVKGQVYMYSYEHRASTNLWPMWLGAPHGYEMEIFFGRPWSEMRDKYTDDERNLSDDIMKRITNMAKTGDPNLDGRISITWPRYTSEEQQYLVLDVGQQHVDQGLRYRECQYWQTQVPILQNAAYSHLPCPDAAISLTLWRMPLVIFISILVITSMHQN